MLLLLFSSWAVGLDAEPPPADTIRAQLAEILPEDAPGAALAIVEDGEARLVLVRGLADVEAGRTIDADTPFYIASLAKTFTATAVLTLEERGQLSRPTSFGSTSQRCQNRTLP